MDPAHRPDTLVGTTSIRPSPGSLRKNGARSVEPNGSGPSQPMNKRCSDPEPVDGSRRKRGGTAAELVESAVLVDQVSPSRRERCTPRVRIQSPPASRHRRASPHIERDVLAFWKADGTFQASIDQREGADEWVFNDGPPFANGLPHYGHLLTGYAKDVFPRFQTMRGQPGAPPLRLGHARTARRARGRAPARHHRQERDRADGHRGLQRGRTQRGAALHEGVAGVRHPPGALGRLRERLQDARHHLHGVGDLGVQDPARQGPRLRGLPRAAVLLARPDAAVEP